MSRVPELDWNVCNRKLGIVPKSLKILLMKRQDYKRASKEATSKELKNLYKQRSDALKWILVCCLPYDSPVLISRQGRISFEKIGKIIDQQLGDSIGVFDCPDELFVAGLDKNFKSRFCKVSKLIKTLSPEKLLQVKMDDGREVNCTPNHSFYVLRNGDLVEVRADNLSKGDLVPVAKRIVHESSVSRLSLLDELKQKIDNTEDTVWRAKSDGLRSIVASASEKLEVVLKGEDRYVQNIRNWAESGIVPLRYLNVLSTFDSSKDTLIGRGREAGGHMAWLPSSLELDEELGFFLGFYVADGSAGENFIRLDVGGDEREIVDHLSRIIKSKFGLTSKIYKETKANMFVVQVNSASLVQTLNLIFELPASSAFGKLKVPPLIFNGSKEAILGFLSGLVAGDGSVNKDRNYLSIATHSYDFAVQIGYLALRLGMPFNILRGKRLHRIYFSGPNASSQFKKLFLKNRHRIVFDRFKTSCNSDCRHAIFEMFPVEESGLRRIATLSRTVRSPRLEGRVRVCPGRAAKSLARISQNSHIPDIDYVRIEKLLNSDIGFVAVKGVKETPAPSSYVYCFEIADNEESFPAFFTGAGNVLVHNSFGYLGFKNARFGKIDAHIAVCALSRDVLTRTTQFVRENGYDLLHGIVDSTWLRTLPGGDASPEGFEQVAKGLGKHFDLPVSFEGVYRWIVFLPSKVYSNRPVLNRYYGIFSEGRLKIRGIALRRHDSAGIVTRLQNDALNVLGKAEDADEFKELLPRVLKLFVDCHLARVRSGNIPTDELVIRKNLSKGPPEYSHRVLQAVAAQQLRESGFEISGGQTVGYVILKDRLESSEKQVIAEGLTNGTVEYDVESYVSLLVDGLAEILGPVGFEREKIAGFAAQS